MTDGESPVLTDVVGSTMTITLNRPAAMNAQNQALREGLVAAVERFELDDDLRVAILIGAGGRAFSAGADLKELSGGPGTARGGPPRPVSRRAAWVHFEAMRDAEKPIIAAIDGHALGGGLELALYCDIRVCTEQSQLGLPEPRTVGGTAGPGLHLLSRSIPYGEAMHLQLTGRPISGRRAYEIGLVQRLCADRAELLTVAHALAEDVATCSPDAVRTIKRIVRTARGMTIEQSEGLHLALDQTRFRAERS